MSAGLVLEVLVVGLAAGAAYGLVGIGFALVYRLTGVLELAHGDLLGSSVFLALLVAAGAAPVTRTNVSTVRWLAGAVVAVAVAGLAGALLYVVVVRPFFRRRADLGWIGATAAVAFALEGVLGAGFRREGYAFPDVLPFDRVHALRLGGGATLPVRTFWVLGVGVAVWLLAQWALSRSRSGEALVAIADDPVAAALVGLPVDRLVASAFALAGMLAAVAGLVVAPAGTLDTRIGLVLGLKGIAAALLGGLGRPRAVFAAALALGMLEAAVASWHVPGFPRLALGPAWRDVAPLLVVLGALALRAPQAARVPVE